MTTVSGLKQREGNVTWWPWTLSSIRKVIAAAMDEGYRLGIRVPALAIAARKGDVTRNDVPEALYEGFEEMVEARTADAEVRFVERWEEEVAGWIEMAIEAAAVLGLKAYGDALSVESESEASTEAAQETHDHPSLISILDTLLAQVVETLAASGHPVPGSQEFLDRHRQWGEVARMIPMQHTDARREARTDWIRDYDTGRPYQWCILRDGTRLFIGRRRGGERSVTPELVLRAVEADLLCQMITRVAEGWREA